MLSPSPGHPSGQAQLTGSSTTSLAVSSSAVSSPAQAGKLEVEQNRVTVSWGSRNSSPEMCSVKGAWLTTGTAQVQQPSFVLCDEKASSRYWMAVSALHVVCSQGKIYSQRREQKKAWLLSLGISLEFLGPLCKITRWGTRAPNILLLWNRSIALSFLLSEGCCAITPFTLGFY